MSYREPAKKPRCDAVSPAYGTTINCKNDVVMFCVCRKCENDPDIRMHTCVEDVANVTAAHLRVYGISPQWITMPAPSLSSIADRFIATHCSQEPVKDLVDLVNDWGGAKQW